MPKHYGKPRSKSKRSGASKKRVATKALRSSVKAMVKASMQKQLEQKYRLNDWAAHIGDWNSGHHGAQIELSPNFDAGTGPSQVIGQDVFLKSLQISVVWLPGISFGLLGLSDSSTLDITQNPFATPRPVRYAIVAMDRSTASNLAGNFYDLMNYLWTPDGAYKQDFVASDAVQALARGTKILRKGTFIPRFNNVTCNPDGSSASKARLISVPTQTLVSLKAPINKKLSVETAAGDDKNFQDVVYSLYLSDYNGESSTYGRYTDPKAISVKSMFVYTDA